MILGPTGLFAATDWGTKATNNPGAHGFSEILYEFSSASANNGSGFEGLADTWGFNDPEDNINPPAPYSPYWDIATGLVMLISRFIPIIAPLALAGMPGGEEADPVHGRHAADRHAYLRLRAVGHGPARGQPCCSCRRQCWGRWRNTWVRYRLVVKLSVAQWSISTNN